MCVCVCVCIGRRSWERGVRGRININIIRLKSRCWRWWAEREAETEIERDRDAWYWLARVDDSLTRVCYGYWVFDQRRVCGGVIRSTYLPACLPVCPPTYVTFAGKTNFFSCEYSRFPVSQVGEIQEWWNKQGIPPHHSDATLCVCVTRYLPSLYLPPYQWAEWSPKPFSKPLLARISSRT